MSSQNKYKGRFFHFLYNYGLYDSLAPGITDNGGIKTRMGSSLEGKSRHSLQVQDRETKLNLVPTAFISCNRRGNIDVIIDVIEKTVQIDYVI